ncbi:MAG: class I SAM-dependent methyltransferase [Clostridiales bacterium]|jgi:ubiquinone/menaquinone biosynthesis C-methylase UbiE|nr:class I SAM-dependent methyltransferase [Clostridiales bacterium]
MVVKSTTEIFDSLAAGCDTPERIKISGIIASEIRWRATAARRKTVIGYGCGTGLVGFALMELWGPVIFVDVSAEMIKQVRRKIENAAKAAALRADFSAGIPPGLQADDIIMAQTLLHIKDVRLILSRLHDALRNEGRLFTADFDKNGNVVSDMAHNGFAQAESLNEVFASGFAGAEAKTFYHGKGIFMGGDASMFMLEAQK